MMQPRARGPLLFLLLLVALLLRPGLAGSGSAGRPPTVSPPTNVEIESFNFKTVLHWDYSSMVPNARFTVEIKPYELGYYAQISSCVNISRRHCDLSDNITDPLLSHWAKVKAHVGSEESSYVESKEFILANQGKIGTPTLTVLTQGNKLKVDIFHPACLPENLLESCDEVEYLVYFQDHENQTEKLKTDLESCEEHKCSISLPVASEGLTYCVSAEVYSWCEMRGDQSNETCLHVPLKWQLANILIGTAAFLAFGLILASYYVYNQLKKKNIKLPKSLVAVVRNLNSRHTLEQETKYISVITSSSAKMLVCDKVTVIEEEQVTGTPSPEDSCEEACSLNSQETSSTTEEGGIQESTSQLSPNTEQSSDVKDNYFTSNSSQMELHEEELSSNSKPLTTDTQNSMSQIKFSGYDKPHVPLDMLVDVGEEESVIEYRH
ncbi:PREDICTED: interferon gamma receptor 1 [Gavialis gangeticus]|uniref:interferon gamma receptor 1 n=1 Tax=Gavialis gangeticus TaxID=94835 RepID=UPI00092E50BF|nr:PREDICTED: interferon gamma receptor 1 [Gavialis gangeticus]